MSLRVLVSTRQQYLKWPALDWLEIALMMLCGFSLLGFTSSVVFDVGTRLIGRPWLWLQEVTSTFFVYGTFLGAAVATRRNDHLYLTALPESMHGWSRQIIELANRVVVLGVALMMVVFGYVNFLRGFGSFRMPSMTPIASLYACIPISGLLIAVFAIEQIVNGWRNGFDHPGEATPKDDEPQSLAEAFGHIGR